MDILVIRNNVILDFENGLSTKELMLKYGYSKSTINDWVRETRNKTAEIEFDALKEKYIKLQNEFEKTKLELEIYKELNYLISTSQPEKLNAIEKLYNIYSVKPMCRILNISVGTLYNHLNRRVLETQHIINDNKLRPLVLEVFESSKQRFGSTKIAQILRKNGHKISNEKAKKLMNELNIKPIFGKKEITIPQNVESKNKYLKNLVNGNFKREVPNEVWGGDVTEIIIQGNKFYICVIIDLFSRKVIAYRTSYKNNINLISNTLKDSFVSRGEPIGVIFHSDRGSNYTSYKYRMLLKSLKIRSSYSKTARPRQNAVVESFFSFLKKEELYRNSYESLEHLNDSTHEYILFYNDFRPHYHLNGKKPNEFEKEYLIKKELTPLLSEQSNLELK